ncbi:hypothetical protein Y032_0011g1333 [Ancylostoma ceylanicum]|uniref:polynucleotide adenylyltransferase n=1 Tax=Ancylostoma ceylanicum TaxID=53326 RepID=A0A016VE52_9BILA|nr:hypothetical protein Y032_0011g1333 [Ancylostoma ceylanicum]
MKSEGPYVASTTELTRKQIDRLRTVLNETVEIHGKGNFPTISARLIDIISCVREKLRQAGMPPKSVKLNGGAASHVASADDFSYADLDLIFPMDVENSDSFDKVREAVFDTIMDMMPSANKTKINADTLKDVYIGKMVKVSGDDDRWSLFSLHNDFGRCIELKFVDKMRRQFEFSVDSFQITLDPLLDDFNAPDAKVYIESMFGDVHQAMSHLHERLIDTRRPEEIRGGGLLKYCHLLTRGYKAARPSKCRQLERYMCSRFFIDFPDVVSQEQKLRNYLDNHFGSNNDQRGWSCTDYAARGDPGRESWFASLGLLGYAFMNPSPGNTGVAARPRPLTDITYIPSQKVGRISSTATLMDVLMPKFAVTKNSLLDF